MSFLLPSGAAPAKVSSVAGLRVRGAAIVVAAPAGGPRPAAPADPAVMLRPPAVVPGARVGVRLLGVAVARVLLAADVAAAAAAAPPAVGLFGVAALGVAASATVGLLRVAALGVAARRGLLGPAAEEAAEPSPAPERLTFYSVREDFVLEFNSNILESA